MYVPLFAAAQVIARKKAAGFVDHVGILLPDGTVAHCAPSVGVAITSLQEFAAGQAWRSVRVVPAAQYGPMIYRIRHALAECRPYDALTWNCETFANWATGLQPESPQAWRLALAAAAALVLVAGSN